MDKTSLANIALGHIGSALIQSFDELSPSAQHVRRMWDLTRDKLMRERPWNFALHRVTLSKLAQAPLFGYDSAYALPADYLLAVEWNGMKAGTGSAEFAIEGAALLCDAIGSGESELAELLYVRRVEAVTAWEPSFCDAFSYALASAIAPSFSGSAGLADAMAKKAELATLRAFGPDNTESRAEVVLAQTGSKWLAAREGCW